MSVAGGPVAGGAPGAEKLEQLKRMSDIENDHLASFLNASEF